MFPTYESTDRDYSPDPEFVARVNPDNQYLYHKSHLAHLKLIRETSPDRDERDRARDQVDFVLDRLEFWSKRTVNASYVVDQIQKIDMETRRQIIKRALNKKDMITC